MGDDAGTGTGPRHVRAVGAIIFDSAGRLLVVQRGHEPSMGLWAVPGGKVEPGETDEQAVAREIREETGLVVRVGALAGSVERPGGAGIVFEIFDYDAVLVPEPAREGLDRQAGHASSDAADLRWVTRAELAALPLTYGMWDALQSWSRLP